MYARDDILGLIIAWSAVNNGAGEGGEGEGWVEKEKNRKSPSN